MNKAAPLPAGSAPDSVKRTVLNLLTAVTDQTHARGFVRHVLRRIVITELSLQPMVDSAKRQEWLLVCELDCEPDMANINDVLHGGAAAYLVDTCSSLAIAAAGRVSGAQISQAINMVYHAPAPVGHRLRVVNRTISLGSRVMSAHTDIWDATSDRLCASGTHIKMVPSPSKL